MVRETIERMVHLLEDGGRAADDEERARIAVGALLVECARVNADYSDADRAAVAAALVQLFGLDAEVTEALVAIAEKRAEDVWHDWILTEAVKRGFDAAERRALIGKLWGIAGISGALERREERFVRRIAKELEVPAAEVDAMRSKADPSEPGGGAGR